MEPTVDLGSVESIHLVRLAPGEVLWVTVPDGTSVEHATAIREHVERTLGLGPDRVIVAVGIGPPTAVKP